MIKKFLGIFLFSFITMISLSSCGNQPSIRGSFFQDKYVLDLNEEIDFEKELDLIGVNYQDIDIVFSDPNIIIENEDGYVAQESGQTLVFAKYQDLTIASTNIIVNYVFSEPSNVSISRDGVLMWDEVYINKGSKVVKAEEYILKIDGNNQFRVDSNTFNLKKEGFDYGRYQIQIMAEGIESENVKSSSYSEMKVVVYDFMSTIEELSINVSTDFSSQQATFSWKEIENAVYDVYLDGFKVNEEKVLNSTFTYDFGRFENGKEIDLTIVAYDLNNEKISVATNYKLNKLNVVNPSYSYENSDGALIVNTNSDANNYLLSYVNLVTGENGQKSIKANEKEYLSELSNGIYKISVQALGGFNNGKYYLNSNVSEEFEFAKLDTPNPVVEVSGQNIQITFSEDFDNYVSLYKIKVGSYQTIYNVQNGYTMTLSNSAIKTGENIIEISALPSRDSESINGVKDYVIDEFSTNMVLNSNAYVNSFYKLENASTITHQFLDEEKNKSILSFDNVSYADNFKVFVNDIEVGNIEIEIGSTITNIKFENLKSFTPNDNNQYEIVVQCFRNDGLSINSFGHKTLTILESTSKSNSVNGQYNWDSVIGNACYQYTIYKSDSSYESKEFYIQETTNDLQLKEELSFGYYKIEIVSLSTNEDVYLDSNFAENSNIFEDNFLVYQQIESPVIELIEEGNVYKLKIFSVEYAGNYTILLDGQEIDSFNINGQEESFTRTLTGQTFDIEKTYVIEVVAKAGEKFDENLHKNSRASSINIVRLSPTFEIEETYSNQGLFGIDGETGRKIDEIISVYDNHSEQGVEYYDIFINGIKANIDNSSSISIMNQPHSFEISFSAKSIGQNGNTYYLDSATKTYYVERVENPTNLLYNNEIVSFENNNIENIEKYFVEMELFVESGNKYINFFIDGQQQSFNLQEKIDDFVSNNILFANEFNQASKIGIKVWAYTTPKTIDDTIILQSMPALTTSGENQLIIEKLQSITLSFDANETQNILSWNNIAENSTYDIYKNNLLIKEDISTTQISLSDLVENNELISGNVEFKVVAKNGKYLNSSSSNVVKISKLNIIDQMQISKQASNPIAILNVSKSSDARRIKTVLVNGEEISYTTGENVIYVDLSNFVEESYTLNFVLQAKNNEVEDVYYIDSQKFAFNLFNIKNRTLSATVENGKISWQNPYDTWQEEQGYVFYKIIVNANDTEYVINNFSYSEISLQEIETLTKVKFDSQKAINVSIYSYISPYFINSLQTGYYGEINQTAIEINKVFDLPEEDIFVKTLDGTDMLLNRKNSKLCVEFENIWSGNVAFDITVNNKISYTDLSLTNPYVDCQLSLNDNVYTLTFDNSVFELVGDNIFTIQVKQDNKINSNVKQFSVQRNNNINFASVDNNAMLEISYGSIYTDSIILKIVIGSTTVYKEYQTNQSQIDLSEILIDLSGNIDIEILVFDSNNKVLPSKESYKIDQSKLAKIQSIEIADDGQMIFNVSDALFSGSENNIEFVVRNGENEEIVFTPRLVEGNFFKYEYTLQELKTILNLSQEKEYELYFANREINSINSDFYQLNLGFAVEKENYVAKNREALNKDYLIFKHLSSESTGLSTVGFRFTIKNNMQEIVKQVNLKLSDISNVSGYWDGKTNKFLTNMPSYDETLIQNVYQCFAFSINDLFADWEYGCFTIEVMRIAKENNIYTIFNSKTFNITKLNNVVEDIGSPYNISVADNNLLWHYIKPDDITLPANFVPSAYLITVWPVDNEIQKQTFLSSSNMFDLSSVKLTEGYNYVNIQAVSDNLDIISSSYLQNNIAVYKYGQTKGITLENGNIVFDLNTNGELDKSIDFVKVFDTSVSGENIADSLASNGVNGFKDIYYFQTNTINLQTIKIKFVSTNASGDLNNGQVYYATINAMNLIPKFQVSSSDFISQIDTYINDNIDDPTINYQALKDFYEKIKLSSFGLTSDKILFDDFGRTIPAGYYNVSLIQTATNKQDDFIDSDASVSSLIYVASAPSLVMESSYNQENGEEIYTATYTCVDIAEVGENKIQSYSYMMLFRTGAYPNLEVAYKFKISKNENWIIEYYDNLSSSYISDGLDGVIWGDEYSFTINFSALEDWQYNGVSIDKTKVYDVNVYAVGNDYSSFGKNSQMTLTFLSLSDENIFVENGYLIIRTSENEIGCDISVKYKVEYGSDETVNQEIEKIPTDSKGQVILNEVLKNTGKYEYVIFNVLGQINNQAKTMKLPSLSYGIVGLYKLNQPILTTQENQLMITADSNDANNGPFKYSIESNGESYISEKLYFDSSSGNKNYYIFDHLANDINLSYNANISMITGSVKSIGITDNTQSNGSLPYFEKLVDFGGLITISSDASSISLQQLATISQIKLDKGDFSWTEVSNVSFEQDNVVIVYKIQVDYFDENGIKNTQYYWTKNNYFDSSLIESYYAQGVGKYFNLYIYTYAGIDSVSGNSLVEGGYIQIADNIKFANGKYVLHSNSITITDEDNNVVDFYKEKQLTFYNSNQLYDGKIAINRTTNDLMFDVKAINENNQRETLTEGIDFVVDKNGIIITSGNESKEVYFISIINEDFADKKGYVFEIYAYTDTTIKSDKLITKTIYKLKEIQDSDFELILEKTGNVYNNVLSFYKYFENNLYDFSNDFYEINLYTYISGQEVFDDTNFVTTITSETQILTELENYQNGTFALIVKPKENVFNYLNSEIFVIEFTTFEKSSEFTITYDDISTYKFNFGFNDTKNYEFFMIFKYSDNQQEVAYIKEYVIENGVKSYYYQPNKMGVIEKIVVYCRELNENSLNEDNTENQSYLLNLFGQILFKDGDDELDVNVEYKLFESGNGTQSSPYIISNAEQFNNIKLRDSASKKIYFKLNTNIDFNINLLDCFLLENLYGSLDGNGKLLNISFVYENNDEIYQESSLSKALSISKELTLGDTSTKVTLTNALSLIGIVHQDASISNLRINYGFDFTNAENSISSFISGVAYQNDGVISNVVVDNINVNFTKVSQIAFAGIVAINNGELQDCINNSNIVQNLPQNAITLVYGGLAVLNQGSMKGCLNNGSIDLTVRHILSYVFMGGLAYENNNASIVASGNNGDITIKDNGRVSNYACGVAGVVVRNLTSQINYVYNNGIISTTSNNGGSSGIIYRYQSGYIGYIFETTDSGIIHSSSTGSIITITDTKIYGYTNLSISITNLNITKITSLSDGMEFNYDNQYSILINKVGDEYTMSHEKM